MKQILRILAAVAAAALVLCCGTPEDTTPARTAPPIPANLKLSDATTTSLTFVWDASTGADRYLWRITRSSTRVSDGETTSCTVTVPGLEEGTQYAFSVRAASGELFSSYANLTASTQATEVPVEPGSVTLCTDAPLTLGFDSVPTLGTSGCIRVFKSDGTQVDCIDLSDMSSVTLRDDGTMIPASQITADSRFTTFMDAIPSGTRWRAVHYTPLRIKGKSLEIKLHSGVLDFGGSYYVTVDESVAGKAVGKGEWTFSTAAAPVGAELTVLQDGTGDFCTLQGALTYASSLGKDTPVSISVGAGTYAEMLFLRDKNNLTVTGTAGTVIAYPNNESYCSGSGASLTSRPSVGSSLGKSGGRGLWLIESCDNLTLRGLTVENTFGELKGQAECIYFNSNGFLTIDACSLLSYQDTFLCKGKVWVHDSLVAGHCDFIWGYPSVCLFENCEIRSRAAGYIVQARVPSPSNVGFVFLGCNLTAEEGVKDGSMYLARSAGASDCFDNVVFVNCTMSSVINSGGWFSSPAPNPSTPTATSGWREWGSVTPGGSAITSHNSCGRILTAEEAVAYSSREAVLGF